MNSNRRSVNMLDNLNKAIEFYNKFLFEDERVYKEKTLQDYEIQAIFELFKNIIKYDDYYINKNGYDIDVQENNTIEKLQEFVINNMEKIIKDWT
jgi:hypothetical protein